MTDEQFLENFERLKIDPADFNHAAHVRMAFLVLQADPFERAVERIRKGLLAFARHAGRPEIYDDELTRRWIERIEGRRRDGDRWEIFREREKELLVR